MERNKTGAVYLFKACVTFVDSKIRDVTEQLVEKNDKQEDENILITFVDRLNGSKRISESTE